MAGMAARRLVTVASRQASGGSKVPEEPDISKSTLDGVVSAHGGGGGTRETSSNEGGDSPETRGRWLIAELASVESDPSDGLIAGFAEPEKAPGAIGWLARQLPQPTLEDVGRPQGPT